MISSDGYFFPKWIYKLVKLSNECENKLNASGMHKLSLEHFIEDRFVIPTCLNLNQFESITSIWHSLLVILNLDKKNRENFYSVQIVLRNKLDIINCNFE